VDDTERIEKQLDAMATLADSTDKRVDRLELTLPEIVRSTVKDVVMAHTLTADERGWVRMALEREARRETLQRAIIEKSLAGLVWAAIAGIGAAAWQVVKAYLKQP